MSLVFTCTKLGAKFNIKDEKSKEHQHDLTYSLACPDATCNEEYNGETGIVKSIMVKRVYENSGKDVNPHVFKHSMETDHPTVTLK